MGLRFLARSSVKGVVISFLLTVAYAIGAQPVHAQQPVISAVFTQSGGFFNYNFTVRNLTAFTLADVNIATGASSISSLVAPTGFQIVYDANGLGTNQGVVDFFTDTGAQDFFAGSTVSGFMFRSSANLSGAAFNALDVQGNSYNGTITTTAAPEPGTLGLMMFGGTSAAALLVRRRRYATSVSLKG